MPSAMRLVRLDWTALVHRGALIIAAEWFGPLLFQLCFQRTPDMRQLAAFKAAIRDFRTRQPVVVRAMLAVPASRTLVSDLLLRELQGQGRLPPPQGVGAAGWTMASQVGDPLRFWDGAPVSFMHFEKTAGTAVANALTRWFHPLQIDADPNRTMPPHLRSAFAATAAAARARDSRLVWGHYDLPSLRRLGAERLVVTMLREPRARILSLYRYWRSVDPAALEPFQSHEVRLAHGTDLLEFLRHPDPSLRDCIDNLYARRLTGLYGTGDDADPLWADPQRAVRLALDALETLSFVGVVERMEASLDGLSAVLGVTLARGLERENDSEANAAAQPGVFRPVEPSRVTPEIEAELARLCALDDVIYAAAAARLEGRAVRRAA